MTLSTPSAPEEPLAEALLELPPPAPPPPPVAPLDKVPPPLDMTVPLRSEPRSLRPSGYGYRDQLLCERRLRRRSHRDTLSIRLQSRLSLPGRCADIAGEIAIKSFSSALPFVQLSKDDNYA